MDELPKRGRGRPRGSKTRRGLELPALPDSSVPNLDYQHADPDTLVSRQFSMIQWAQQALHERAVKSRTMDPHELEKVTNALVRCIDALKRSSDVADEMSKRMTGDQLLEAAMKKIEGQDAATVRYSIKRLRAHLEKLGVQKDSTLIVSGNPAASALEAIASLGAA